MVKFAYPGQILKQEYLEPASIKAADLAHASGLSTGRISEILNGKRDITAEIAYRLERATKVSAQLWLGLQNDYDPRMIEKKKARQIKRQTHILSFADFATAE